MKIQATTIKKILAYPAMASMAVACTDATQNKPTNTPPSQEETNPEKLSKGLLPGWIIEEEPQIEVGRMLGPTYKPEQKPKEKKEIKAEERRKQRIPGSVPYSAKD